MSRILFLTWNGAGNQPPAIGLAQELRSRRHDIVFAGYRSQRARIEERGFRFTRIEGSDEVFSEAFVGGDALAAVKSGIMLCALQLDEVPELFAREHADALVVDCMMFGALAAAEVSGLPAAVLVHTAPGAMCGSAGTFGDGFLPELNALRTAAGAVSLERTWDAWRGMSVITNSIRPLDPLADAVPPDFNYVGPIFEQVPAMTWRAPWSEDDDRPLVLVSFSTSPAAFQGQRSKLERTLRGLASMPCRILATFSGADVSDLRVPDNAVLVQHLPHTELLPQVSVTVTHAGHGTTIAALTYGVPLVCLPQPSSPVDQAPLAAQVEALGAGLALDGDGATPEEISDAVLEVLSTPTYRARAGELADLISQMPGAVRAAGIVEGLADNPSL